MCLTLPFAGALLDDNEKQRLAEWMRYRGKPPQQRSPVQKRKPQPGSKAELQSLFDQIVIEVNDRQQYLEDMAGSITTKEYVAVANQIKREIQDRVQEMKRLDQLLKGSS